MFGKGQNFYFEFVKRRQVKSFPSSNLYFHVCDLPLFFFLSAPTDGREPVSQKCSFQRSLRNSDDLGDVDGRCVRTWWVRLHLPVDLFARLLPLAISGRKGSVTKTGIRIDPETLSGPDFSLDYIRLTGMII